MSVTRRGVMKGGAAGALSIALAGSLDSVFQTSAGADTGEAYGYGPLIPDPKGVLDLPKGFSYKDPVDGGRPDLRRRRRPRPPRRHGHLPGQQARTDPARPQPRAEQQRHPRRRARRPHLRPGGQRRHHHAGGRQGRRPAVAVRQPRRDVHQLRGRAHPLGHLADL